MQGRHRLNSVIRRKGFGWTWMLIACTEMVMSGTGKSDADCRNQIRNYKTKIKA